MPGIGFEMRMNGAAVNRAINGETVTFREAQFEATVLRFPVPETDAGPMKINLNDRDTSKIDLPWDDLPPHRTNGANKLPVSGEIITDAFGYKHRVQKARRIDFVAHCECEVSYA
jgi:hypothetical protein